MWDLLKEISDFWEMYQYDDFVDVEGFSFDNKIEEETIVEKQTQEVENMKLKRYQIRVIGLKKLDSVIFLAI